MNSKQLFAIALLGATVTLGHTAFAADSAVGTYVDDATITTKVKAALVKDESLKAFDIHVYTSKDVVRLTGAVKSAAQKAQAVRVASSVSGVLSVTDDLTVQ
jgi:osmotically-inducible protein OsmY